MRFRFLKTFILSCIVGVNIQAQDLIDPENTSPYATMVTHLQYLQPESYDPNQTLICFNPNLDSITVLKRSKQLKMIFDSKGLYVYPSKLPKNPDFLDSLTQQNIYTPFPIELPQIYVEKYDSVWLYSDETFKAIPGLIKQIYPYGSHHLVNLFPNKSKDLFLGISGWQFLGILAVLIIAVLIYYLLYFLLHFIFERLLRSRLKNWNVDDKLVWNIARLFSLIIVFRIAKVLLGILQFSVTTNKFLIIGFNIAIAILVIVLLFRITNLITKQLGRVVENTKSKMDDQLLPIINSISKIIVGLLGSLYILSQLEVNVTAILAGISIGGLALALAAQDTVKNLIGSLMIFVDRPFQIGDFVEIDGQSGTVEEVGFRTTRIRTADTSIVAIPNGNVANISVNNKGVRPKRLINLVLGVTYNTPLHYLKVFKTGLEQIISNHPKLVDDPQYVFINALDSSSINIKFMTYVETLAWAEELEVREEVIFSILGLAEELGINLAFPSSTVYIDQMPGQDALNNAYKDDVQGLTQKMDNFFRD